MDPGFTKSGVKRGAVGAARRLRCQGIEGDGYGDGVFAPQPTTGFGERCNLLHAVGSGVEPKTDFGAF